MKQPPNIEQGQEIYKILCDALLERNHHTYDLFHNYLDIVCSAQRILCAKEYMKDGSNPAGRIKNAGFPYEFTRLPTEDNP